MLAVPAAFMDAECETLCGRRVLSRTQINVASARRTSDTINMWLVDLDLGVVSSLYRVADLDAVDIVDFKWKPDAPSVWPRGKGIKDAVDAWMTDGRCGGDEDDDAAYVPKVPE